MNRRGLVFVGLLMILGICASRGPAVYAKDPPATGPANAEEDKNKPVDWDTVIGKTLGVKGTLKDDVYTVVIPRTDIDFEDVDTMPVPGAAIGSTLQFFKCSCGMLRVVGEICVIDYESNDVIDALRAGNKMKIASISPMFVNERPRKLLLIRFQGEAHGSEVAEPVREALRWTGEQRDKPDKGGDDQTETPKEKTP